MKLPKQYFCRHQRQDNGIGMQRVGALMYFLWGSDQSETNEAYRCDLAWLKKIANQPVDLKLTLEELE